MRANIHNAAILIAGLIGLFASDGSHAIAAAPFLANLFLLTFVGRMAALTGLLILLPLYVTVYFVSWFGIVPHAPALLYAAIAIVYGLPYFLPFAAHRLLAPPPTPAFATTLIFPCTWVVVEYLLRRITPYGSWASLAYSQDAAGSLAQLATLGGIATVTFVLTWSSSIAAWLLPRMRTAAPLTPSAVAAILALIALVTWAALRKDDSAMNERSVTVASVNPSHDLQDASDRTARAFHPPLSVAGIAQIRAADAALNSDLFSASGRYARQGARIVAWPEASGFVLAADEPAFLQQASVIAHDSGIYLFASYIVWHPGRPMPIENKVAAIRPDGRIAWTFNKAHPIVGFESGRTAKGNTAIRTLDTPWGRIGLAICHDLDFPEDIRAAALQNVVLFIDPSNDWRQIDWLHANMHRYRAIEDGFTLFRPTDHGFSMIADTRGQVRTLTLTYGGGSYLAEVPLTHCTTIYGKVGDAIVWVSMALLLLFFFAKGVMEPQNKTKASIAPD